ncbi:MAG: tetratricopeptide repeat protein [Pseudomonadota bacterium]|nr:tetratricopeptide repeat protein [Pseudomonadota bacterium]
MRPLDRIVVGLVIATGVIAVSGCNRLTFIRPNYDKMKIEQVRQPVRASDNAAARARMSAQDEIRLAAVALQSGDLAGAKSKARAALKADPASVDAHTLLGVIAEREGQTEEAGSWLKKAAELSSGRPEEVANYGVWLCSNGRALESLEYFVFAAQQASDEAGSALANAGSCAIKAGLDDRGDAYLRRSLQLDPQQRLALEQLAALSLKRGNGMEARAFIERRLALPPVTAEILTTARQIELLMGDNRTAERYQQRLRSEFPANAITPGN